MQDKKENIDNKENAKKGLFRRILKFVFRAVIFLILFLAVVSVLVIGLAQTQGFRTFLANFALDILNRELVAKVELSDIKINPFSGVEISDLRLITRGDTFAFAKRVVVDYSFMPLLQQKIIIKKVYLENPSIKILRSAIDKKWNVAFIAKPSTDTSKSKPSKIKIEVLDLVLNNGKFSLVDSTVSIPENGSINFSNLRLSNLNLNLGTKIDLSQPKFNFNIKSLSCVEQGSGLKIKQMNFKGVLDTTHAEIVDLNLRTEKSEISIAGVVRNLNLFGGGNFLEKLRFDLTIESNKVHLPEINRIAHFRPLLGGDAKLKTKIQGGLNDLSAKDLWLETENTTISMNGGVKNVLHAKDLIWYGEFEKTSIEYRDIRTVLPEMALSSIPDFKKANLKGTRVIGTLDSIDAKLGIISAIGNAKGISGLGLKNGLTYSGDIKTENLNLGKILRNESMASSFNGILKFHGKGTSLSDLDADVDLSANNSAFFGYSINDLLLKCNIKNNGLIKLDTFSIGLNSFYPGNEGPMPVQIQRASFQGLLDLRDMHHPKYNLDSKFSDVNLAFLANNKDMPQVLNGRLKIVGEGFHPDSLNCSMTADIDECSFTDRGLMPFSLNVDIKHSGLNYREVIIKSELFDVFLAGDYNFDNILSLIKNQLVHLSTFFINKANIINTNFKATKPKKEIFTKIGNFAPINFRLKANINDVSALNPFLKDLKMYLKGNIDVSFDVDENESHIKLDSINISSIELHRNDLNVLVKPIFISSDIRMTIQDSLPFLSQMSFDAKSDFSSDLNGLILSNPLLKLNYQNEIAKVSVSTMINDMLDVSSDVKIQFGESKYDLELNKTQLTFNRGFIWTASKPIMVSLDTIGLNIHSFSLVRENAETIDISGRVNTAKADNLAVTIKNLPLNEINKVVPVEFQKILKSFKGSFDYINLLVNDSLANPAINLKFGTSPLQVNGTSIGSLFGVITHKNAEVKGELSLQSKKQNLLQINITSLPINLALASVPERVSKTLPLVVALKSNNMPIALAGPFIPAISNLKGNLDASFDIRGTLPNNFEYSGSAKIKGASFLLDPTNMSYYADGDVELKTNVIKIKDFKIYNLPEDIADGVANVNAQLDFDKFTLKYFDFQVTSNRFKVLSPSSFRSMPTLYGDFVIASGANPIRFSGTLQAPSLSGDINVIRGNLTLPQQNSSSQLYTSTVKYEVKGNNIKVNLTPTDSSQGNNTKITENGVTEKDPTEKEYSFNDLMTYDFYIRILGRLVVTIDLNLYGQVYSEIGIPDNTQSLHIVKAPKSSEINVLGGTGLTLKEGSTLKYLKLFKTSGFITFPTGKVDNPGLDLTAEYSGQSYINENPRKFKVFLKITGTKNRPSIKFDYQIDEEPALGDSTLIVQNALFLLATGKTKTELESGSIGGKLNFNEIGTSSTSAVISKMATEMLQGTGVIQSADIDMSGGSVDKANLKLTGQLFGMVLRVGGIGPEFATNNEFSIEVPLGAIIYPELFNNILLQLTGSTSTNQTFSRNQKQWEVKLKYGKSW